MEMPDFTEPIRHSKRALGHLVSTIILRSLATEYLLKSLSVRRSGGFCKTHDLRELFDMLDSTVQAEITDQGDRQGIEALDILTKRRNAFVQWRYWIEGVEHLQFGLEVDLLLAALAEVYEPGLSEAVRQLRGMTEARQRCSSQA